mmetsp:Transcript_22922/g.40994  ORF Transcript_22922/g.40994 Transcript_22922/m.40994 type:complete len:240 (-) Transcript_22922:191-910(-)
MFSGDAPMDCSPPAVLQDTLVTDMQVEPTELSPQEGCRAALTLPTLLRAGATGPSGASGLGLLLGGGFESPVPRSREEMLRVIWGPQGEPEAPPRRRPGTGVFRASESHAFDGFESPVPKPRAEVLRAVWGAEGEPSAPMRQRRPQGLEADSDDATGASLNPRELFPDDVSREEQTSPESRSPREARSRTPVNRSRQRNAGLEETPAPPSRPGRLASRRVLLEAQGDAAGSVKKQGGLR